MAQASDVCGVDGEHSGGLTRMVMALQPSFGDGVGIEFKTPIWEEEVTLCDYHRTSPEFEETPEGEEPPDYQMPAAPLQGLPVRLVWTGETVEQ